MALATLSIDIIAKLANLEQGLARASALAEQNAAKISAAFARSDDIVGKLSANLKGMFAGITFSALLHGIVDSLDRLVDLRDATGSTIENLSALEDLAVSTGTSFEKMSTVLIRFNKVLNDAKPDDDATRTFQALGLSIEELRKLDPSEGLRRTAVAFAKFADDGSKARAMTEFFNKSIGAAGPLLNELAAKTELTAVVTTKAAKEGENLANSFARIQKNVLDAARGFAGPLNSALEATGNLLEKINAWRDRRFAENDIKIERDRVTTLEAVNRALGDVNIREEERAHFMAERNRLESEAPGRKRFDELLAAAGPRGGPGLETRATLVVKPGIDKDALAAMKKSEADIAALTNRYRELFEAEMAVDGSQKELAKAQSLLADPKYAKMTAEQKQVILDYAKGIHSLKVARDADNESIEEAMQHDRLLGEQIRALTKDTEAQNKAFDEMKASLPSSQLVTLVHAEEDLRLRLEKGQLTAEQFAEALNKVWNITPDPALKAMSEMELAMQSLAASIDETLGQGLEAMLTGHFANIGQLFKRMLEQMAVKALQADLMNRLFGAANASGARAGGGWIDSLINVGSSILGASSGSDAITAGASALGVSSAVAPSIVSNTTFEIAAGVSRNELAALMPTITQQVSASVMSTMRRPGYTGA